jgi:2-keto-4-pentenoate hydratase/2-oxohepta-3-ene-1,7-dioic acid hydratase in catechol pathway
MEPIFWASAYICADKIVSQHLVREAGRKPPPFPSLFFKPNTCVHDHGAPIVIPKIAQDEQADYEGELVRLDPACSLANFA